MYLNHVNFYVYQVGIYKVDRNGDKRLWWTIIA